MMRRQIVYLLALLQLGEARLHGFSIHEDLLAFPQFEVIFSERSISENDAKALLDKTAPGTYSADFSQPTIAAGDATEGDDTNAEQVYEVVNLAPHKYICAIPMLQPSPPENQTENELARAEEARELSRATVNGWELVNKLEDSCLYFMSGWWSYRLCNNREIVQFHALTNMANGQPPRPDPNSAEYILGSKPALPASAEKRVRAETDGELIPAELQAKGDQRYLVQKLVGGTVCDLTGRERTVEVQYHCAPGLKHDRIAWIKEVTICAYLMVINTPRLCSDVAFLPPKEKRANPVTCTLISDGEASSLPLLEQPGTVNKLILESKEKAAEKMEGEAAGSKLLTVGGIVVGARQTLGAADEAGKPYKLIEPRTLKRKGDSQQLVELIAKAASKADGGKVEVVSTEDLERLEITVDMMEEMKKTLEEMAAGEGWTIEIVEAPGQEREMRGYVGADSDEGDEEDGEDAEDGEGSKEELKDEL